MSDNSRKKKIALISLIFAALATIFYFLSTLEKKKLIDDASNINSAYEEIIDEERDIKFKEMTVEELEAYIALLNNTINSMANNGIMDIKSSVLEEIRNDIEAGEKENSSKKVLDINDELNPMKLKIKIDGTSAYIEYQGESGVTHRICTISEDEFCRYIGRQDFTFQDYCELYKAYQNLSYYHNGNHIDAVQAFPNIEKYSGILDKWYGGHDGKLCKKASDIGNLDDGHDER